MDFSHSLIVNAPAERVWTLLRDPHSIAPAIPGFQSLNVVDDDNFSVQISQRIGPFRASFDLSMTLTEVVELKLIRATGQGAEAGGGLLKVPSAVVEMDSLGDGKTALSFAIEFTLLGKLGAMGYPLVKRKAGEMAELFGENLRKRLEQDGSSQA
jgi:carbon monoxide dehydrogenase subunit G